MEHEDTQVIEGLIEHIGEYENDVTTKMRVREIAKQAYLLGKQEGLRMAVEMYQCLEDVVNQYGGDCISTSEHAEYLVEKYKDLPALTSLIKEEE